MDKTINTYEQNKYKKNIIQKFIGGIIGFIKENLGLLLGLVAIFVVVAFRSPVIMTSKNMLNVLRQISSNIFLASAMTMVLIAGGIDLSVGANVAFTGVMAAILLETTGLPVIVVVILCLLIGIGIGALNGVMVAYTTMPPFIVTFSVYSIFRGLAYIITNAQPVRISNSNFIFLGTGFVGPVPISIIYIVFILITVYLILNQSILGRHIYAIGGNRRAAEFSGIRTKRVTMFVFLFSGLMAALAGVYLAARMYSGQPKTGEGIEMDAIAACVIGGTSMMGGKGKIGGTVIGAFIIGILNNGLNLMGIDTFWQTTLKGIIIIVAVYVDYVRNIKSVGADGE